MHSRPWPQASVLARFTDDERAQLFAAGRPRSFETGSVVVRQGERTRHVLVIVDGVVKVTSHSDNGRDVLLAVRSRGDLIGELASLDGRGRLATVTAAGAVSAWVLAHREFQALLARNANATQAVSASVVNKLRARTEQYIEISAHSVKVCVARVLYRWYQVYGEYNRGALELSIPISQPELAAVVGAAETSVHKALRELRNKGVITTGYRTNAVRSLEALAEEARIPATEQ